jgi:hypothetical protein
MMGSLKKENLFVNGMKSTVSTTISPSDLRIAVAILLFPRIITPSISASPPISHDLFGFSHISLFIRTSFPYPPCFAFSGRFPYISFPLYRAVISALKLPHHYT